MQIATSDAADYFGGVAKMAAALGVSERAVKRWGEFVPGRWTKKVYAASRERIPANHSRKAGA